MPHNHGFRNDFKRSQKPKPRNIAVTTLEEDSPIAKAFRGYSQELDDKHDRHERIVKLSRDITIEAKRIIFLLHTIDGRKNNKAKILTEAQQRLNKTIEVNFKAVAKELIGQDPYQYRNAYSPGLQEFIEAYSFMEYFKYAEEEENGGTISDWKALQQKMQYEMEEEKKDEKNEEKKEEKEDENKEELKENEPTKIEVGEENQSELAEATKALATIKFQFFIDPSEYILGVSDLTGELMRRCINSLGSGETDVCIETCNALQRFYSGYISLNFHRFRELSRKIYTMRQSVLKAEHVCYNVKVRGGEAAKWGAVFDNKPGDDVDEGFY